MKSRLATSIRSSFLYMNPGAHSGLHVTGGNRNGCSRGAKCSCRQSGRSANRDSSRLRRVGQSACGGGPEDDRADAGSGFLLPTSRPKIHAAGVYRSRAFPQDHAICRDRAHGRTQRQRLVGVHLCESRGRDQGPGRQDEQGVQSVGFTGWVEKSERPPMDPPILRGTEPATVEGRASADRKLVKQF